METMTSLVTPREGARFSEWLRSMDLMLLRRLSSLAFIAV